MPRRSRFRRRRNLGPGRAHAARPSHYQPPLCPCARRRCPSRGPTAPGRGRWPPSPRDRQGYRSVQHRRVRSGGRAPLLRRGYVRRAPRCGAEKQILRRPRPPTVHHRYLGLVGRRRAHRWRNGVPRLVGMQHLPSLAAVAGPEYVGRRRARTVAWKEQALVAPLGKPGRRTAPPARPGRPGAARRQSLRAQRPPSRRRGARSPRPPLGRAPGTP